MTQAQVFDVANVLAHLRRDHGIDTDPATGPLRAADYRFIAESVELDWNTFDTARAVVGRIQDREKRKNA